ncbi:hypothetical protein IYQ92_04775 [Streptococcus sp. HF-1907]|uniref:hypothetical protein n=1 Tax=Streptococcus sp. HF-1907 TaxID=2785793 RepID=UPI00189DB7FE|nr:hypothetical protein [Streptococcus sp. HF-1907]MBF7094566.1 hypothetical protein [Streptococcus sp. HF-1907]
MAHDKYQEMPSNRLEIRENDCRICQYDGNVYIDLPLQKESTKVFLIDSHLHLLQLSPSCQGTTIFLKNCVVDEVKNFGHQNHFIYDDSDDKVCPLPEIRRGILFA